MERTTIFITYKKKNNQNLILFWNYVIITRTHARVYNIMKEILSAAADEEKEENTMADNFDFIGFTYNGKHSYTDFKIYRTSDGSRYNDNLIPTMTDKTADVPGGEGQYFFNTRHKTKQFTISIAFEKLDEVKYRGMRAWLDGKGIHDLIFDELPYKVYSAKVTGTPQLKTVCFDDENGQRVYKGEGTIQFTCYYPYAHTPTIEKQGFDGRSLDNYTNENKSQWSEASKLAEIHSTGMNKGDLPTTFIFNKIGDIGMDEIFAVGDCKITIKEECSNLQWDSKTGLVIAEVDTVRRPIKYIGKSYGTIPVDGLSTDKIYNVFKEDNSYYKINADGMRVECDINGNANGEILGPYALPFTIEYSYWYY